ncbi:D-amino-acid transaminase [Kiloniella sp. b19]|uniref:D-amino-acid transaminase n=1 Tax=Kiloniella sp. GXU_MW_B19 TaxID=3141326 RepID=UPI0031DE1747
MEKIAYVNDRFVPESEASVSVFDRGFLFADGIYEVTSVLKGQLIDFEGHVARLRRSLSELDMAFPLADEELEALHHELIRKNDLVEGGVYIQITRGAAVRDFAYPADTRPTLVMFVVRKNLLDNPAAESGISVITLEDIRWKRRDIKTVGLLGSAMAKEAAVRAGADDAWMYEDGFVTEGSSNNAYIVNAEGAIVTRPASNEILNGITRRAVLRLAEETGMKLEERPFTVQEACEAREAFVTSATTIVMPVVKIDDSVIGTGKPGPVARHLRALYIEEALASIKD